MTFWIVTIALTAAVALAVAMPLWRSTNTGTSDDEHDVEVYRDQLDELERDIARGVIAGDQADLAKAEIARRLIKADEAAARSNTSESHSGPGISRSIVLTSVLAVPVVSWTLYGSIGSPAEPDQPLAERLARAPALNSIEELVARAEKRLQSHPEDVQGWEVLAPIYLRLNRFDDSIAAYQNTIRLGGASVKRKAGLGEALVGKAGGRVSPEALGFFKEALELDSKDARSRFYIATAKAQSGEIAEAAEIWRALAQDLSPDSGMRRAVMTALATAEQRLGTDVAPAAPGPTAEDVKAAGEMNSDDRLAMITSMVEGLDERLREDPSDIEGWKRLMRSYLVLDRKRDAQLAYDRALSAFEPRSAEAGQLREFAGTLGLEETAN